MVAQERRFLPTKPWLLSHKIWVWVIFTS